MDEEVSLFVLFCVALFFHLSHISLGGSCELPDLRRVQVGWRIVSYFINRFAQTPWARRTRKQGEREKERRSKREMTSLSTLLPNHQNLVVLRNLYSAVWMYECLSVCLFVFMFSFCHRSDEVKWRGWAWNWEDGRWNTYEEHLSQL